MCHKVVHRRWHVFREATIVADTAAGHAARARAETGVAGGGGGSSSGENGSVKRCVCSPSQHPGSFRCRRHQAKYVWHSRTLKLKKKGSVIQ